MAGNGFKHRRRIAFVLGAASLLAALSACGTVDRLRGTQEGAKTELEARNVPPQDPMARPIQVAWTSARASHCGFVFNPDELKSNFLASEARMGASPDQMQKIEHAYDYTLQSVSATIKDDLGYCNDSRTAAIRRDLNRYLAGDYTPSARMAQ